MSQILTETTPKETKLVSALNRVKRAFTRSIMDGAGKKIYIPARHKRVFKENLVMTFVIEGTIPSKKNCQVPDANKKRTESILRRNFGQPVTEELIQELLGVKPFIRRSRRYMKWEERIRPDLVAQAARWSASYEKKKLIFPITKATITIYHYWADPKSRDNSNKAESIHDTLVACGILSDDDHKCLYKNSAEADLYAGEINKHITEFTITAHEW